MWVITIFKDDRNTIMYEFNTEEEARMVFKEIEGCKILSEVIYQNQSNFVAATL